MPRRPMHYALRLLIVILIVMAASLSVDRVLGPDSVDGPEERGASGHPIVELRRTVPRAREDAGSMPPPPAPPTDADRAAQSVHEFRIIDPVGRPIPGAVLSIVGESDAVAARCASNADGTCRVAVASANPDVIVRHDAYETCCTQLDRIAQVSGRREIRLRPGGTITGVVRLASGVATGSEIRVGVVADGASLSHTDAARALRQDPRSLTATTDPASGAFTIRGAELASRVSLVAAGPGFVQVGGPVHATVDGAPVTVTVAPLYVLDVTLVDSVTGEPIRAMSDLGLGGGRSGYVLPDAAVTRLPSDYSTLVWTGIDLPRLDAQPDPRRVFTAFAIDGDPDRYGPLRFRAAAPGWRAAIVDVWALRASPGACLTQQVRLVRECSGFGALRVTATGATPDLLEHLASQRSGGDATSFRLDLVAAESGSQLSADLRPVGHGEMTISDLPSGRYRAAVAIESAPDSVRQRWYSVEVLEDRTSELEIDLTGCTHVELLPLKPDGQAYTGQLNVLARGVGGTSSGNWAFSGPPYRVIGLGPGSYDFRTVCATESPWVAACVTADGTARVEIPLSSDGR